MIGNLTRLACLPDSTGAVASTMVGSAWLLTLFALHTGAIGTHMSRCFVHNAGLCWHDCVLLGTSCNGRVSEYVESALVGDCINSFVWTNDAIRARNSSLRSNLLQSALAAFLVSRYLSRGLSIFSPSAAVLIWSRITFPQRRTPRYVFPWSTNGGCLEELLKSFFHHVQDCVHRVCE